MLLVDGAEVVEVEDRDGGDVPFGPFAAGPDGVEAGHRRIEMTAIEQAGQRVADGQLGDLGVQEGVGDREGDQAGDDRQHLELVAGERATHVADGRASARRPRRRHGSAALRRRSSAADRGRRRSRPRWLGRVVARRSTTQGPVADRPAGQPLTRARSRRRGTPDRRPATARTTYRPVGRSRTVRPTLSATRTSLQLVDDRLMDAGRVERPVDRRGERRQSSEQVGPRGKPLAFGGEGQRRRHALGDEAHRLDVACDRAGRSRGLDVDDPEQFAVGEHRRADLRSDGARRASIVGVGGNIGHEGQRLRAHHPAEHAERSVELLDDRRRSRAGRRAASGSASRGRSRRSRSRDPRRRSATIRSSVAGRRAGGGEQASDALDCGHLARPTSIARERASRVDGRSRSAPRSSVASRSRAGWRCRRARPLAVRRARGCRRCAQDGHEVQGDRGGADGEGMAGALGGGQRDDGDEERGRSDGTRRFGREAVTTATYRMARPNRANESPVRCRRQAEVRARRLQRWPGPRGTRC